MIRLLSASLLLILCSGCGLLFQTAVGWHTTTVDTITESKKVPVTSVPTGAAVIRRAPSGEETALGTTPLTDTVSYQIEQKTEHPSVWALLIGAAIEGGLTVALFNAASSTNDNIGYYLGGGLLGYLAAQELVVALIHGLSGSNVVSRKTIGGSKDYLYAGRLAGYPDGLALIKVPDQGRAEIVLDRAGGAGRSVPAPSAPASSAPAPSAPAPPASEAAGSGGGVRAVASWVVAVMDVEDLNAGQGDKALDRSLIRNVGDQLRIFVAQRGLKTIDRGAQEKVVRDQISAEKRESYKTCYDDSCQIELGKALAASHILRSRVTRFGRRCVLNAELIDLRSEVTVAASSSQGDCEAEGFLTMSEAVAANLFQR